MNPTTFSSIKNNQDNKTWQSLFNTHWPAYKQWYDSRKRDGINSSRLKVAQEQLKSTMPELWPIYTQLCHLTNDDPVAMQFLSLYQPPAFLINCSQAVFLRHEPLLIRNYDLSPDLSENTLIMTNWQGSKVLATSECLWGADDGMNEAGLAISLTFGGSKKVGSGFGVPIILRYVLQTCETIAQAIEQLKRIPSHMAYNISMVDKTGDFATVYLAADQGAVVTKSPLTTNHQQTIVWPEQAQFSRTLERESTLRKVLMNKNLDEKLLIETFLNKPLYTNNFKQNFGTVYTAVYKPLSGTMAYHWPGDSWRHAWKDFTDSNKVVQLNQQSLEVGNDNQNDVAVKDFHYQTIPSEIQAQFEGLFSYLPEKAVIDKQIYRQLKRDLQSAHPMQWSQFADSMKQLWQ